MDYALPTSQDPEGLQNIHRSVRVLRIGICFGVALGVYDFSLNNAFYP